MEACPTVELGDMPSHMFAARLGLAGPIATGTKPAVTRETRSFNAFIVILSRFSIRFDRNG